MATRSRDESERSPLLRILLVDDHALFRRGVRDVIDEEEDMRVVAEAGDAEAALEQVRALWPDGLDLVLMDIEMPGRSGISATRAIRSEWPDVPIVMLTVSASEDDLFEAAWAGAVGFLRKTLVPTALVRALRDYHRSGALPMSRTMAARLLSRYQQLTAAPADQGPTDPRAELAAGRTAPPADPDGRAAAPADPDGRAAAPAEPAGRAASPAGAAVPEWRQQFQADRPAGAVAPERLEADAGLRRLTAREREILALISRGHRDREIADRLVLAEVTVKTHVQNILRKLGARNRVEAAARFRGGSP